MSEHTPGPWRVGRADESTDDFQVCEVELFAIYTSARPPYHRCGMPKDDARLISAAPDMLAALRRAVLALAFAAESSPAMEDDYKAVSAAISKATGRSQ